MAGLLAWHIVAIPLYCEDFESLGGPVLPTEVKQALSLVADACASADVRPAIQWLESQATAETV